MCRHYARPKNKTNINILTTADEKEVLRQAEATWLGIKGEILCGQRDWAGFLEEVGINLGQSRGAVPDQENSLSKDGEANEKQACVWREEKLAPRMPGRRGGWRERWAGEPGGWSWQWRQELGLSVLSARWRGLLNSVDTERF